MSSLSAEIRFYEKHQAKFKRENDQDWVIISGDEIIGFFSTFESASKKLQQEYNPKNPNRRFLVRRINQPMPVLNGFKYA